MRQQDSGGLESLCSRFRPALRGEAISYAGRSIRRRWLFRQKEDCARALVRWGVSAGDPVLLCVASTPEFFCILLAIWKLGAVPHLLDPERTLPELRKALRRSGARLLLVTDRFLPQLETALGEDTTLQTVVIPVGSSLPLRVRRQMIPTPTVELETLPFQDFLASGRRIPVAPGARLSPEALAAVVWQGPGYDEECRLSHGELAAEMKVWEETLAPRRGSLFGMLPPWRLAGLPPLLAALGLGVTVILEPEMTPAALEATLLRERPPRVLVTPALWRGLRKQPGIHQAELAFLETLWMVNSGEEGTSPGEMLSDVFFPCPVEIIIV